MKRWLIALLIATAVPALAQDWQAELTPVAPGVFPMLRPLTASYRFGWGAVAAADADIVFSRSKKDQLQFKLTAKTNGFVRTLWQLDAEHVACCSATTLRPICLKQTERYRDETEKTTADFTADHVLRVQGHEPPLKTPVKPKRFKFPDVTDLHTALLLVRSQALQQGDRYSFVVYPSRTAYLARIEVQGRERLKVGGQEYDAVKLQLSLKHITKKLELEPHEKFKSAHAWLSDDKDRLLLKVQAEVFVGSVWMEMRSVKFAEK